MYIYHELINALSAHMIHINLNRIFYTHVEHSPTKTIYKKYYTKQTKKRTTNTHTHIHTHTHTHTRTHAHTRTRTHARTHARTHTHTHTHTHTSTHSDCSRNWVLILVRMEILWEEEGFQFGFKRWQGWAVSKVLWEWISNVGSEAREGAKPWVLRLYCWISSMWVSEEERNVWDGV